MTLSILALGSSGWNISTLGFGSWAIGGGSWSFGWGPQDDTASPGAMRHARDVGINWIDTAAVYARLPQQMDVWINAVTLELSPADLDEIASAIAHTGAGVGPTQSSVASTHGTW